MGPAGIRSFHWTAPEQAPTQWRVSVARRLRLDARPARHETQVKSSDSETSKLQQVEQATGAARSAGGTRALTHGSDQAAAKLAKCWALALHFDMPSAAWMRMQLGAPEGEQQQVPLCILPGGNLTH